MRSLCVCMLATQSCLMLCNPMYCSPPDFSLHEISQARILEWAAISLSAERTIMQKNSAVSLKCNLMQGLEIKAKITF